MDSCCRERGLRQAQPDSLLPPSTASRRWPGARWAESTFELGERHQGEEARVHMVLEKKVRGESGAGEMFLPPGAVLFLRIG